jgi:ABC-type multidrug transport system ATPase subunit
MKEKALGSIVSLFALVAVFKPGKGYTLITNILDVYLTSLFTRPTTEQYLDLFQQKIRSYIAYKNQHPNDFETYFKSELDAHCYILSREVTLDNRVLVLIYLIEYVPYMSGKTSFYIASESFNLINTIAQQLEIPAADFKDAVSFSTENYQKISDQNALFVITDNDALRIPDTRILVDKSLKGQLIFIKIKSLNTILFKVSGESYFEINDRKLYKRRTYILNKGAVIHTDNGNHFYYNDIARSLTPIETIQPLVLNAEEITFRFNNGVYGIQPMSFQCHSGEIIAIMGGSGSGKTTLMNLLIGARKPHSGIITLNDVDVYKNPAIVKGHIGYVPQDDALIEELTAFENLYFIAGLSSKELSREAKIQKVEKLLEELDLQNIRNLKVGNPLDKVISGGQRKRLNIAIELIRDPGILFLDEPTSGLSSADSENIMQILKNAAAVGRMVILNIHQPSSDIFKLFDKLLFIDQGGYAVYFGPAMQIPSYLKKALSLADAHENECQTCGNLNPDDIFHLIQSRKISNQGTKATKRIFSPEKWHRRFMRFSAKWNQSLDNQEVPQLKPLPVQTPGKLQQYLIYSVRNVLTKVADFPYLLLSLTLPLILGLLLSVFARYIAPFNDSYSYYQNDNMPPYIFMSVIVAMFVGIMSGSGEIIKERKTLKRESFLNLSYSAFIFAKFTYLMVLSGVQMISYVLISKWILQIPAGNYHLFVILWSTTVSSSIIGLALSSVFKTMASVYVSIPFVLIPQILFSGAVIDFNKINPLFASDKYVPAISEVMMSRWVYETISVSLFMDSDFAKALYPTEKALGETTYTRNFLLPEIEKSFFKQSWSTTHFLTKDSADFELIVNGIQQVGRVMNEDFSAIHKSGIIKGEDFSQFVNDVRAKLMTAHDARLMYKDSLIAEMGSDAYNALQHTTNKKLMQLLTDEANVEKVRIRDNEFIRKMTPVYFIADNPRGRSHLYAPAKRLGSFELSNYQFNSIVIWLMSLGFLMLVIKRKPSI